MNSESFLTYISKYIDLSDKEQQHLLSKVRYRSYLKGQYVLQQGDVCTHKSFVISGCLKTFHLDSNGQEHVLMFAIENCWTSDLESFITQAPSYYHVQCLEDTMLAQLSFNDLEQLYHDIPKLERLFRIVVQKEFTASQCRIIDNNSLSAKEQYLEFRKRYPEIEQRVPQYLIASYLGITKEFLSKIRNHFLTESSPEY